MEKIYGAFKVLLGYKEGNYYLLKKYGMNNTYSYFLAKNKDLLGCFQVDFDKAYNNKEIKLVYSCNKGKELLKKLRKNEIDFDNISSIVY